MPNGGHDCTNCQHLAGELGKSRCKLRGVEIPLPHWTTCANGPGRRRRLWAPSSLFLAVPYSLVVWAFHGTIGRLLPVRVRGPLEAIVGEVKGGAGGYVTIPYLGGSRPETVQAGAGDTVVRVIDGAGQAREFADVDAYVAFAQVQVQALAPGSDL